MTQKITSAVFAACVTDREEIPRDKPIIALVGRSNVGKSSLINVLANRKELARTSATPGKTLTINFYEFNESYYIVDLPGYGYAKASRATRERIQRMMDAFFQERSKIVGIIQILDIRHPPTVLDLQMNAWISEQGFRHLLVLTKTDKLGNSEIAKMKAHILKKLNAREAVMFSAKTKYGREELLACIQQLLESPPKSKTAEKVNSFENSRNARSRRKNKTIRKNSTEKRVKHKLNKKSIDSLAKEQRQNSKQSETIEEQNKTETELHKTKRRRIVARTRVTANEQVVGSQATEEGKV